MIVAKFFVCSLHSQVTVIIAPAYVRIVTLYLFVPLMYMPQSLITIETLLQISVLHICASQQQNDISTFYIQWSTIYI